MTVVEEIIQDGDRLECVDCAGLVTRLRFVEFSLNRESLFFFRPAKGILADRREIRLPPVEIPLDYGSRVMLLAEDRTFALDDVQAIRTADKADAARHDHRWRAAGTLHDPSANAIYRAAR